MSKSIPINGLVTFPLRNSPELCSEKSQLNQHTATELRSGKFTQARQDFALLTQRRDHKAESNPAPYLWQAEAAVSLSSSCSRGRENTFRTGKNGIVKIVLSPVGGDRENT